MQVKFLTLLDHLVMFVIAVLCGKSCGDACGDVAGREARGAA